MGAYSLRLDAYDRLKYCDPSVSEVARPLPDVPSRRCQPLLNPCLTAAPCHVLPPPQPAYALYAHFTEQGADGAGGASPGGSGSDPNDDTVSSDEPAYRFAVITDVQYADVPDGQGALGAPRHYRWSLGIVNKAVAAWGRDESLAFGIHVGDMCARGLQPLARPLHRVGSRGHTSDAESLPAGLI